MQKISNERNKLKKFKEKSISLPGEENVDFIVCRWCKLKVKRIYGIHLKNHHPNKTTNNFPRSLLTCLTDKKDIYK